MRPSPQLVLKVGLPHTGGPGVGQALRSLRPQLRDHGVAYISQASRLQAERRRTATRASGETVLIGDDTLLGPARPPLGNPPGGVVPWFPQAAVSVGDVIAELKPAHTTLVVLTRRQDRVLELDYADHVLTGGDAKLDTRVTDLLTAKLDYVELLGRLATVPGVDRLVVHPYESVEADHRELIRLLLDTVGLAGVVDLSTVPSPPADPVPTPRGLAVARGMNAALDTAEERRLVRDFVLEGWIGGPHDPALLAPGQREAILVAHAEANRKFFESYCPGLEPGGYADDAATLRLSESGLGLAGDAAAAPARAGIGARALRFADRAAAAARRRVRPRSRLRWLKKPTDGGPGPAAS